MNTATDTLIVKPADMGGGQVVGQLTTSLVGFYGTSPIAKRGNASQAVVATVTDGSTGAAAATNGIAALTGTYNSTLLINAIATLAQQGNANAVLVNELRAALVALGLIKGSA